jgi:hypothetical protein
LAAIIVIFAALTRGSLQGRGVTIVIREQISGAGPIYARVAGLAVGVNTQAKAGVEMRKRTVIAIKLRIVVSRWNPHRT